VGIFAKDKSQGKFITDWEEIYNPVKKDLEEVDVSPGMAMILSVKDDDEKVTPLTTPETCTRYDSRLIIENDSNVVQD
jgi:nucleosome binding factor SPN SPT16 subunit